MTTDATRSAKLGALGHFTIDRLHPETEQTIGTLRFEGWIIGAATSRQRVHRSHGDERFAPRKVKCSACRWNEVTIYVRQHPEDNNRFDYVVVTVGASEVPGEVDLQTITETSSAFEVLEALTVRPRSGAPFLPGQYASALAQAASRDDDLREAYLNRAVA